MAEDAPLTRGRSRRPARGDGAGPAPRFGAPGAAGVWPRLSVFFEGIFDGARRDLDEGAARPLLAVVFAFGIALYFALPDEPWPPAVVALAAGLSVAAALARRRGRRASGLVAAAAIAAGVALATVETRLVAAPRLDRERTVMVEGRITDLDATAKGGTRLGVEVARMEAKGLPAEAVPRRITATLTVPGAPPRVGEAVAFRARLKPPEGPVLPGGYDFARRAWFDGRGAGGYVLGRTRPIDLGPAPVLDRVLAPIGELRHAVADRVRARLPGASGAIGAALMVGEQRAIPEEAAEPLRASGLTHIVSISGLHMSLVAGGVMVAVRLLFAVLPGPALRLATKKWAAAAALLAATVYLLLSGNQVAALRSHLMLSIALLAVIVDRPAITLHTVAVAAVAILLLDPSAVMEPSFQMSFLAVIALVASWDLWQLRVAARPPPRDGAGPIASALSAAIAHVEGLAFSSLVAGLATAPVIAGVFYRGAPYSILANMIVLPVTGLLIMPAAVVAALAMPFGLDGPALAAMGIGIDFMVWVARRVAALPGGAGLIGAPHWAAMPLGIAAVLWLSGWRSRIRLFGLVPAVLSAALLFAGPRPDVLVGRHGGPVAVRDADGRLAVLAAPGDRFDVAIWLAADRDGRMPGDPSLGRGWRCDPLGCALHRARDGDPDGLVVAVVRDARGFAEDCRRADVVVSRLEAPPGCAAFATVIDRTTLDEAGALALDVGARDLVGARAATASRAAAGTTGDGFDPTRDDAPVAAGAGPPADAEPIDVVGSAGGTGEGRGGVGGRGAAGGVAGEAGDRAPNFGARNADASPPAAANATAPAPANVVAHERAGKAVGPESVDAPAGALGAADLDDADAAVGADGTAGSTAAPVERVEPVRPRRAVVSTASLARPARPWTPRPPPRTRSADAAALTGAEETERADTRPTDPTSAARPSEPVVSRAPSGAPPSRAKFPTVDPTEP